MSTTVSPVERMPSARAAADLLLGAQEVEAGHGLDRLAHLARLQPKGRVLERLLHLPAGEGADLAPLLGARALRELARERREVAAVARELTDLLRLGANVGDLRLVGARTDREEDVAHAHSLAGRVVGQVGLVVALDLLR